VGAVDDPAGPQDHGSRPGGRLKGLAGPLDHPGTAAVLVAVGGVDQGEQDDGVHPGQGTGEGGVARPGLDELELGTEQRRLVPGQAEHPLDPGVVLKGQGQLPGRRVQRPDQRDGSCCQDLHLFSTPSPKATH
jgi:hypothetical protein